MCPSYDGTNYAFVSCFVRAVHGLAGTWGYYIGDELSASSEPDLRHLVDAVYDVDPSHPRLYVASGINGLDRADLTTYGRNYCDGSQCHPDATVVAQDFYPIGAQPPGDPAALTDHVAGGVQAIAQREGDSYAMVLQAHSLSEYPELYRGCSSAAICPYPTMQQMLAMRDAVLAHPTPHLILWYSDFDLQRSGDYQRHWSDLIAAVNQGRPQPTPSASATVVGTAGSRAVSRPAALGVQPAPPDSWTAQAMAALLQALLSAGLL